MRRLVTVAVLVVGEMLSGAGGADAQEEWEYVLRVSVKRVLGSSGSLPTGRRGSLGAPAENWTERGFDPGGDALRCD